MREKKEKKEKKSKVKQTSKYDITEQQEITPVKKRTKKSKVNREITLITYTFVGLFVLLIGYYAKFLFVDGENVINNSYNKRQEVLEKKVNRGMILSSDGDILAKSVYDEEGNMTRIYPYKNLFSHSVGRYLKGKTGLESSMSFPLLTASISPLEQIFKDISGEKTDGDNVITTLDVDLQKAANTALGNNRGAVVVMEPSTGKILALVSKPNYDPNQVDAQWEELLSKSNEDSQLFNRATQGVYSPGSIYKIITALGYMRQNPNYEEFSYTCDGTYEVDGKEIKCSNNKKHGTVNFEEAFAKSCNGAFASMLETMNISSFATLNNDLLFNRGLGLDVPVKESSFSLSSSSDAFEIAQTAMGQGKTTTTPVHFAMLASAIANGGVMMKPYIVDRIENYTGDVIEKFLPKKYATIMNAEEAQKLTSMMELVVTKGTATKLKTSKYTAAGKTGTAEVAGQDPNSWFVGFASTDSADVVVSVIVEDAGSGSDYAVPIAKKVFEAYYKKY